MKTEKALKPAPKFRKPPRMAAFAKADSDYVAPATGTVLLTLHNKLGNEVRIVDIGRPDELPRVVMWEWRAYLQDLASEGSTNYFETNCHHVWG